MSVFDAYQMVIGLECHVQLLTNTKLFSRATNRYGDAPNTNVDVLDAGLPGTLPVINERAVELAIRLGHALGCDIRTESEFARKHYFYPDLPKGYQISQFDKPICEGGSITVTLEDGTEKTVGITRIHIEEDAGKNTHVEGGNASFVDYNRAGTPLVEIVTEPDMRSAEEAMAVYKALRAIVTYIGVCDGNLQEGSMRADCNVSVMKKDADTFGQRTEMKNINSIRFVGQAIDFEARRQILELESGNTIVQETRLWDSSRKESRAMRSKEEAHDYRYFPCPDLLPLVLEDGLVERIKSELPELPGQKRARFESTLGLSAYDAGVLTDEKAIADYFETALSVHQNAKGIANWVINEVLRVVKAGAGDDDISTSGIDACPITAEAIGKLVKLIDDGVISGKIAKQVFAELAAENGTDPEAIVEEKGWKVERDEGKLKAIIAEIVEKHPDEVERFRGGKKKLMGFFVGQVMKATQGKADPKEVNRLLGAALNG